MRLEPYLKRIGFDGTPRADIATLRRLHRAHTHSIPYENLDVQLGRPVSRDVSRVYDKIVEGGRGGWCYEQNGLLGWALEQVGFRLTRLAGAVRRSETGDMAIGNHLVLIVHLDQDYLADTGFGDGLIEPVPLRAGRILQGPSSFVLEKLDGDWWRFHGEPRNGALSYDFETTPADPSLLERQCQWLQSSPDSVFVQNAVAQRHLAGQHAALRGCLLRIAGGAGETRELASADEYVSTLADVFGLDLPEAATLWPRIIARHRELFPDGYRASS